MQRLLNVCQPPLDVSHDADKVIDIQTTASRTGNHGHATIAKFQRLENLPSNPDFLLWLGCKRYTNRIADSFVQENAETDGRLHRPSKSGPCLRYTEVKRIINLLRQQSIRRHRAVNVRS